MAAHDSYGSTQVVVHHTPTNGLGVAGFVMSLLGILGTCGLLSPLGMVLSFFGMFREPKGLAIAGFILGIAGSIWLIIAVFVIGIAGLAAMFEAMGRAF